MSNRLLIKSVMCANDQGVFEPEEKDSNGRVIRPRRKIKERINIPDNAKVNYHANLQTRKLKVTVDGTDHELPIDDYSLSLAGRD